MRFNRGCGVVITLSVLVFSSLGCGGGSSSGPSGPTGPASSLGEQTGPRWVIASDTSGPYVGRFHAADGTELDAWRGGDGQLSALHLLWTDGRQIQTSVDEVGRPLYFQDASGRQLWVNEYGPNNTVDVTLASPAGTKWRGLLQIPAIDAESFRAASVNARGISHALGEPTTIGNRFCDKRLTSTLGLTLTAACLVTFAAAVLSGGIAGPAVAPFFILTCAPTLPIPALLESQLCSYVSIAATTASDPSRVSIAPLQHLPSPIPAPPQLPKPTPLPPAPPSPHLLTVTKGGGGAGTVTSSPGGISCGSDCQENYMPGTVVTLTAAAATNSTFGGWSGDADCSDGSVTMSGARSCAATFSLDAAPSPTTHTLTVSKSGTGSGTVTSAPAGISCGSDCQESYAAGTAVTLTATAASGSTFGGWSGDVDCSDGSVTMTTARSCAAEFMLQSAPTPARATLLPGQVLRVRFRLNPPFTLTPETLVVGLGLDIDTRGLISTGAPTVTFTLFDGQAHLGQSTFTTLLPHIWIPSAFFKASEQGSPPDGVVVPFSRIVSGTIDGLIEVRIDRGSLQFNVGQHPQGDVTVAIVGGPSGWVTVYSIEVQ